MSEIDPIKFDANLRIVNGETPEVFVTSSKPYTNFVVHLPKSMLGAHKSGEYEVSFTPKPATPAASADSSQTGQSGANTMQPGAGGAAGADKK